MSDEEERRSYRLNLFCDICGENIETCESLAAHYCEAHGFKECTTVSASFSSARQFYNWKIDLETSMWTYFGRKRRSQLPDGRCSLFFPCVASWADCRTYLKNKKFRRLCPAFIKANASSEGETVEVVYCTFHYGHCPDEKYFWKQIRQSLHGLLSFQHKSKQDRTLNSQLEASTSQALPDSGNFEEGVGAFLVLPNLNKGPSKLMNSLERDMAYYWNGMKERMNVSGRGFFSITQRWTKPDVLSNSNDNTCVICRVSFKNRKTMLRHIRRLHEKAEKGSVVGSKFSKKVRCLFCNVPMAPPAMKNLIQHYAKAHGQGIALESTSFQSTAAFLAWRTETAGKVFRRHKSYTTQEGELKQYWICKFSGKLKNPPQNVTEGHCPAWLFACTAPDDSVTVSYCYSHIGHDLTPVPRSELVAAEEDLAMEMPWSNEVGGFQSIEELLVEPNPVVVYEEPVTVEEEIEVVTSETLSENMSPAPSSGFVRVEITSVEGERSLLEVPLALFPTTQQGLDTYFVLDNARLTSAVSSTLEQLGEVLCPQDKIELAD